MRIEKGKEGGRDEAPAGEEKKNGGMEEKEKRQARPAFLSPPPHSASPGAGPPGRPGDQARLMAARSRPRPPAGPASLPAGGACPRGGGSREAPSRPGRMGERYPVCFSESEEDLARTAVNAKVQMIINNLQSEDVTLDASSKYGCIVQKKQKAPKDRGPKFRRNDHLLQEHINYTLRNYPTDSDGMDMEESAEFGPLALNSDSDDSVDRDIEEAIQEHLRNKSQNLPPLPNNTKNVSSKDEDQPVQQKFPARDAACHLFPAACGPVSLAHPYVVPGQVEDNVVQWASSPCSMSSDDSFEQSIKAEIEQFLKKKKQQARKKIMRRNKSFRQKEEFQEKLALGQKSSASRRNQSSLKQGGKACFSKRHPELQSISPAKCLKSKTSDSSAACKTERQTDFSSLAVCDSFLLEESKKNGTRQRLCNAGREERVGCTDLSDSSSDDGIEEAIQRYQLEKIKKAAESRAGCVSLQNISTSKAENIPPSLTSALPEITPKAQSCRRKDTSAKAAAINRPDESSSIDSDDSIEEEIQRFLAEKAKAAARIGGLPDATGVAGTLGADKPQAALLKAGWQLLKRGSPASEKECQKVGKVDLPAPELSSRRRYTGESEGNASPPSEQARSLMEDGDSQASVENPPTADPKGIELLERRAAVQRKDIWEDRIDQGTLSPRKGKAECGKWRNYLKATPSFKRKHSPGFETSGKFPAGLKGGGNKRESELLGKRQDISLSLLKVHGGTLPANLFGEGSLPKEIVGSNSEAGVREAEQDPRSQAGSLHRCSQERDGSAQEMTIATEVVNLVKHNRVERHEGGASQSPPLRGSGIEETTISPRAACVEDTVRKGEVLEYSPSWSECEVPEGPCDLSVKGKVVSQGRTAEEQAQKLLEGGSAELGQWGHTSVS
ncbi:protein phosphatase 1 regulatory subunit 26 [Crotalus adamanteus]|uniref:Protein phosphatase 1 regulatory subunit 26 n=1 Tax=Crotalus adamanteus TaxID=8729 RepID=A0AAW1ARU3_CROAD